MPIKIAERLRPFSHVPGASCLLPKSGVLVQVFPTLLCIEGFEDIKLELLGPFRNFTVVQDLEAGQLCVFADTPQGYVRYFVTQEEAGISIRFDKFPTPKETILIPHIQNHVQPAKERLSLGMHKAQDWEMIRRRRDLKEIFPLWARLGGLLPDGPAFACNAGILLLVDACGRHIEERAKTALWDAFQNLFHAGFYSMLVPRLIDDQFQGLVSESNPLPDEVSPLFLVKRGAALIRSLFFQEREDRLALLPCLPPEFHAGRYLNLKTSAGDELDLEWSKKLLKKAVLRSSAPRTVQLALQKEIKTFRLRTSLQDLGRTLAADESFAISTSLVFLDRFQK